MSEIQEKPYYEMLSYQRSGKAMMVKGKLFLATYSLLKRVARDNYTVEFYHALDLNEQRLLVIREIVKTKVKRGKEEAEVEDCNLYVTRISNHVWSELMSLFTSSNKDLSTQTKCCDGDK